MTTYCLVFPGLEENSMSYFEVSPDGQYLVFMGKHGKMHLISSKVSVCLEVTTLRKLTLNLIENFFFCFENEK